MHGAIAADALRVPWIPVITNAGIPAFKWSDWCQSMELAYKPHRIYRLKRLEKYFSFWNKIDELNMKTALIKISRKGIPSLSKNSVLDSRLSELNIRLEKLKEEHQII